MLEETKKKRKKWPIILGIVLGVTVGVPILFVGGCSVYALMHANDPAVPSEYWNANVESAKGTIEKKYAALGEYESEELLVDSTTESGKHFMAYYPTTEGKYPLVVMVNGTGVACTRYKDVFKHLASWGFVVVGNDYETSWDGKSSSETLNLALSYLSNKVDENNIGIMGHSQGGEGVFNAITQFDNGSKYKTAVSLSPTNLELAASLKWTYEIGEDKLAYNPSAINIPTSVWAATGAFDSETVTPLEKLEEIYEMLSSEEKMMVRRDGVDHGDMLYKVDGYTTAWFMHYLKGEDNSSAFYGENAEITTNSDFANYRASK